VRAGELLGRTAYDPDGRRLGRVIDVIVRGAGPQGRLRLTHVVVGGRWYGRVSGRLVGAHPRPSGPWPLRRLAALLARDSREVPFGQVRLDPPVPGFPAGRPGDG
jgi:hypothetical protein